MVNTVMMMLYESKTDGSLGHDGPWYIMTRKTQACTLSLISVSRMCNSEAGTTISIALLVYTCGEAGVVLSLELESIVIFIVTVS